MITKGFCPKCEKEVKVTYRPKATMWGCCVNCAAVINIENQIRTQELKGLHRDAARSRGRIA